uniref:hypothetical protein n=2 Tax=Gemmiger formicilis TaxID=745368 RepID=UPI003FF0E224
LSVCGGGGGLAARRVDASIDPYNAALTWRRIFLRCAAFFHASFKNPTHLQYILNFVKKSPKTEGNPVWQKKHKPDAARSAGSNATKS